VAGRFSISFPGRRDRDDPWFRIGALDVTTSVLVPLLCVIAMFVWAASPTLLDPLVLWPDKVLNGQVWRLLSWPIANAPNVWTALTIAMLWFFGRELERMIGRNRYAWMLVLLALVPGVVGMLLDIPQAGIRPVEIAVFCVFCAELPDVRFFGGIPAWVFAAVIVVIELLQLLGLRESERIILLVVSLATAALTARAFGLLDAYPWIPKIPLPGDGAKGRRRRKAGRSRPAVVQGPWGAPGSSLDQTELDMLLDKISASGMDSLSKAEKQRLNELSKRLRGS
jgi:membrane associated rhomboid family serine protease